MEKHYIVTNNKYISIKATEDELYGIAERWTDDMNQRDSSYIQDYPKDMNQVFDIIGVDMDCLIETVNIVKEDRETIVSKMYQKLKD